MRSACITWFSHNHVGVARLLLVAFALLALGPLLRVLVAEALVERAESFIVYGMYAQGTDYLRRALVVDGGDAAVVEERAFLLPHGGNRVALERARTQLMADVRKLPNDAKLWWALALVDARLGDRPGAYVAAMKSNALEPRPVLASFIRTVAPR